ncbi:hypothetical protein LZ31DRAFT_82265 [Colletotrichum somersetense]|nr:hypothetical protein LZ31DRAFT_82265 [Colletotrichum somersetense]
MCDKLKVCSAGRADRRWVGVDCRQELQKAKELESDRCIILLSPLSGQWRPYIAPPPKSLISLGAQRPTDFKCRYPQLPFPISTSRFQLHRTLGKNGATDCYHWTWWHHAWGGGGPTGYPPPTSSPQSDLIDILEQPSRTLATTCGNCFSDTGCGGCIVVVKSYAPRYWGPSIVCPGVIAKEGMPFSSFGASNRLLTRGRIFRYMMPSHNSNDNNKPICSVKPGRWQPFVLCFLCWRVKDQTLLGDNIKK